MNDISLGDDHGQQHEHDGHDPDAHHTLPEPATQLSVDDVLAQARLVERTASICLRADLRADHDRYLDEIATLVTRDGQIIAADKEASLDAQTNTARARELAALLQQTEAQMRASMWQVRFRAMDADEWAVFFERWWPKAKGADLTEFRTKIVAACAINPELTEEQVKALRKKFNKSQMDALGNAAYDACSEGGLDVPKSRNSWDSLTRE